MIIVFVNLLILSMFLFLYISDTQLELRNKARENGSCGMILDSVDDDDHENQLTCCGDCTSMFKIEALSLQQNNASNTLSSSSLPPWLKDERQRLNSNQHQVIYLTS